MSTYGGTTDQPAASPTPAIFPNPSGLRIAVEIQGGPDQWLLIPIEMLTALVHNGMVFRRSYVTRSGSGYSYELVPEPAKSVAEKQLEGFTGFAPQIYETSTLIAKQVAARMAEASTTQE